MSKGIRGLSDIQYIAQPSILNCTIDLFNVKSTILAGPLSDYSSAFDSSSDISSITSSPASSVRSLTDSESDDD